MIFFLHMSQNEAILDGILHQRRSQDVFRVARLLSTICGRHQKSLRTTGL
jgi:hypothetical protein